MSFWTSWFGRKNTTLPPVGKTASELEIEFDEWIKRLRPFARDSWIPKTEPCRAEHSPHTKFGGLPYLTNTSPWPECPHCQHHLQLFVQVNLQDLPKSRDKGLIQLFYCTNSEPHCESDLEAYFPFSPAVVCRHISLKGNSLQVVPRIEELFEEKRVVGWERFTDYPHREEYEALGLGEPDEEIDEWLYERGYQAAEGDKLLGWPHWVQGPEYPNDRKTGEPMKLFFQLDSEVNLPFMFGDSGVGHLMISTNDQGELAFGWACC